MRLRRALFAHPLLLVGIVLLSLSAVGCGADDDALVVYSGRSETLVQPVMDQFEDLTGIEVKVKYGGTAELAATLLEEGDGTPADVFFAQDPGGLGAVEGMLSPLPAELIGGVPGWARSPSGLWVGVSGRARVLVYNPDRLSPTELPDDIWDLTDPKWKGRLGWAPTNGSFLTMVTGMRMLWGEEKTRGWIEGIVANDPRTYPKNTPQVQAVADGEIDIGMPNHYYLYRFLAEHGEDFSARNYHTPAGGPGALVMVAGAGVLRESDNEEAAERFIDFLLSAVAQQYFAGQTFEYPLVEGVKTNRLLTPLDEINQPTIPLASLSDLSGTTDLLRSAGALP
jgi:iron(III) transport system substrate-binding protein